MTVAAGILNIPHDQPTWDQWAFNLSQNISDIADALRSQRNVSLPRYVLYPIPWPALTEWQARIGIAMGDICANLRIPAVDVENVDLEDDRAKQAWIWSLFSEIRDARGVLKI